jgi:UDP-N-acetyl-D-glucosamine/UDP-N-acetyl-D-galactosamine dehydrogenase
MTLRIGVVGLGYVGLPVALAFARHFPGTVGFDIDAVRVDNLKAGDDWSGETSSKELLASSLIMTANPADLAPCNIYVVCIPTPIHADRRPDLGPLSAASKTVGKVLSKGDIVVYESTVYPGATEDFCGPILTEISGLVQSRDFKLGYSPERINPGDQRHKLENTVKIVAGEDEETTAVLAEAYGSFVEAGIHRAPSIKVAEAAKVLENTQRDLNIALMNEVALICDRLGIRTKDVLDAAGTKWNFLKFTPGLVGGHCIGVDPYYLTAKAQEVGYHPEVILAGRRINDAMGGFVARKLLQMLGMTSRSPHDLRIAILGLTFKENVADIRNSRVPDIVAELASFGVGCSIVDPHADADMARDHYGLTLTPWEEIGELDALVLAVPHEGFVSNAARILDRLRNGGVLLDLKSAIRHETLRPDLRYWSL